MARSVFLSYARSSSREHAQGLYEALGGSKGKAFLDTSEIEKGQRFPRELADSLLGASVVVVFADEAYFERWYCLRELRMALGPWDAFSRTAGSNLEERNEALEPIVVALPSDLSGNVSFLDALPSTLRTTNWPRADETDKLVELIEARLERSGPTIDGRLGLAPTARLIRDTFLEESALPGPKSLAQTRLFPKDLPISIGDRFVGRGDDLSRLHLTLATLTGGTLNAAALTGALEGGAGFGKTRIALEYLHRFGPAYYPGGLFWVDADAEEDRLEEQFHGILRLVNPRVPKDVSVFRKQGRNAALELGEALHQVPPQDPVLFLVDNVPEPAPGEAPQPLERFCPALGKVTVVATSRMKLSVSVTGNIKPFSVQTLAPDAAVLLLTQGVDASALLHEDWQRIAEWVGFLPLALELLNRAMQAGGVHPREVLEQVGKPTTRELDQARRVLEGQVPANALRGITETMAISYRRLSPKAQHAARLLACLSHEPIPLALIQAVEQDLFSSETRAALTLRSFVSPFTLPDRVPVFGVMHRTLADFLQTQSPELEADSLTMVRAVISLMDPEDATNPVQWPVLSACLPHARELFARGVEEAWSPELVVSLGCRIGVLFSSQGVFTQARYVGEQTFQLAESELGDEHPDTLLSMGNLARMLSNQGEHESARELEEKVLEAKRRILGEEHPGTLTSMGNLAATLLHLGELGSARELEEKVLEARRRLLGEEHPDTLLSMGNLARTLSSQGERESARELEERVLEASRRILGEEHPDTLRSMGNLAVTFWDLGERESARELEERVLEASRRILGEEHPDTLLSMGNLARTLSGQGELESARELEEKMSEIKSRSKPRS